MIMFVNRLDPDQAQQNVEPGLHQNFDTVKIKILIRTHIFSAHLGLHCLPISRKKDTRLI